MKLLKFIYKIFIRLSKIISRKGIYPFLNIEFKKISSSKKVLTIGAGGEVNLLLNQYSKKNSFDLASFDIEKNMQPDILGDICTFDFKKEKYDYFIPLVKHHDFDSQFKKAKKNNIKIKLIDLWG